MLVDIGNTRVKWAWWQAGALGAMRAAVHADWAPEHFEQRVFATRGAPPSRILVVSVAGPRVERLFTAAARRATGLIPELLSSSRRAAGVTTRYREPWRLGADRFAAVIGAHRLAGRRNVCVVNVGTTATIDLVDGLGVHRGGVILPGPEIMVASLKRGTAGIAVRARERSGGSRRGEDRSGPFARSTQDAIDRGALYALAATVERVCAEARRLMGRPPLVVLTGGGAHRLEPLLRIQYVEIPDLVLQGVAVQAGLAVQ